jgi:type I restriction enzyme, S subunit
MTSEWVERPLGELVALQRGHDLPTGKRRPGAVPIMGSAGITGYHDKATTQGPGVVIGRSGVGSMGVVSYIDRDYWALNTSLYVTDFRGNDVKFIYYLLSTINFRQFDTGSAQASLNRNLVYPHRVRVPSSVIEQEEIARTLSAIDDRIALLRETNSTLEAMAQALFKSWFVDFDPVRAKQEGRASESMDENTAWLFSDGFEESELGLVPTGWGVLSLGDVVDTVGGATPDTKEPGFWEPAEFCWTTPKDLSGARAPVLLSTERKLSAKGLAKISSGLLPTGTLLMSSRAPIGYLAIAKTPLAINQGYIAMLPGSTLPPLYLLFWCRRNMEGIKARANGSTFMEISKKAFRPIPILVPPGSVIQAFTDVVAVLFDRLVENEKQAQTLSDLRDVLLPRLISGQLRLPEVEALVA